MPTTLNQYTLGRTLGSGVSCKVKLAKDSSNSRYAIKIIHNDASFDELITTEVQALQQLQHENIVRLVEVGEGQQKNPKKGTKTVKFIVLELVGGGELFDFVALGGRLSEETARYYYRQLLSGLSFMHEQGLAHRDLKPENLLLDRSFALKITDFGFAAPTAGRDGSGLLQTQLGTASYMAPEIHLGKAYEGPRVDLFASAIILFVILTQRPPFTSANPNDPHYRLIAAGSPQVFWQAHAEAEAGNDIYSAEFKDFFEKMMVLNPSQRPTIEQIMQHPWMNGPVPTDEQIREDFTIRKGLVEQEAHNEREEKRRERATASTSRAERVMRSGNHTMEEGEEVQNPAEAWQSLEVEEYGEVFIQDYCQFFMSSKPMDYFQDLNVYLSNQGVQPKISGSTMRLQFNTTIAAGGQPQASEESKEAPAGRNVVVSIQILRVSEGKCAVKFTYKDPQSKSHIRQTPDVVNHYLSIRNAESLKIFCDTTFEEQQ